MSEFDRSAFSIRAATAADARQAGPLIYAAGPALFGLLFGPREVDVTRFFRRLFELKRNPFSYEHAFVAEQDGHLRGVMIAASVRERRGAGRRMWWLMPLLRGPLTMLRRLPEGLAMMRGFSPPPADAYYVGILAVDAGYRGQGIGAALLTEAAQQAAQARCPVTVLHVELDNTDALRFYVREGFCETGRFPAVTRLVRQGIAGFVTMERASPLPEL